MPSRRASWNRVRGEERVAASNSQAQRSGSSLRTTPAHSIPARLRAGTAIAVVIAIGWFLLALTHPTTTYHFDPFLVVIAPVALTRFRSTRPLRWRVVLAGSGIGAGVALATTVLLNDAGALRGPALIGPIGPVSEVLIAILLGVIVEAVFSLVRWPRRQCPP